MAFSLKKTQAVIYGALLCSMVVNLEEPWSSGCSCWAEEISWHLTLFAERKGELHIGKAHMKRAARGQD